MRLAVCKSFGIMCRLAHSLTLNYVDSWGLTPPHTLFETDTSKFFPIPRCTSNTLQHIPPIWARRPPLSVLEIILDALLRVTCDNEFVNVLNRFCGLNKPLRQILCCCRSQCVTVWRLLMTISWHYFCHIMEKNIVFLRITVVLITSYCDFRLYSIKLVLFF